MCNTVSKINHLLNPTTGASMWQNRILNTECFPDAFQLPVTEILAICWHNLVTYINYGSITKIFEEIPSFFAIL